MKSYIFKLSLFSLFIFFSCAEDDDQGEIIIDPVDPGTPVFIEADPNLNDGVITFEETGPSFSAENMQPEDRSVGNWSRFGGDDENGHITIAYVENPNKTAPNESDNVVEVTEPAGVQSWAGFYFMLSEKINFPAGKEAIKLDFHSPGPGHNVLLKLEDELANGTEEKKSTGDFFAVTEGTGWETLVFNVPEGKIEDGAYNTMTMILGYGLSNDAEVKYYIDNIDFATPKEVIIPDAPTTAPDAPSTPADQVISIFSDAYTDVEGTDFNPDWGQSTAVSFEEIASNNVMKYEGLNYQGTAFASALDVSGKTKLHVDYFTGDSTTLNFFLISDGAEKAFALDVTNVGEWNSVDIDLSHYSDVVDLTGVIQFKVDGNGTVYFDNIYFYGVNSSPSAGPAAPGLDAANVTSIFSDSYTAAVTANTNPDWGQATVTTVEDLDGNNVLKYAGLNYQGTDWASEALDVSAHTHVHFSYWTAEATKFKFFLVGDGETAYEEVVSSLGTWNSVSVPLSTYSSVVNLANVIQFKVDDAGTGEGATIYFDDLLFYTSAD